MMFSAYTALCCLFDKVGGWSVEGTGTRETLVLGVLLRVGDVFAPNRYGFKPPGSPQPLNIDFKA